jgi:hypothetical protein
MNGEAVNEAAAALYLAPVLVVPGGCRPAGRLGSSTSDPAEP